MKILLVEDNQLTAELLATALSSQHYAVDVVGDGEEAWRIIDSYVYDLILLDIMLPKRDGISLCRLLRSQGIQTPVILLTAQDDATNKVMGLDAGADDYITKPFDLQEVLARIRALLRRGALALPPHLKWNLLSLDPSTCEVTWSGKPLHLTPKEYALLELFMRNNNRIFSCSALIDHLWSFEEPPSEDTVRSHLKGLRMKLRNVGIEEDPIETVYGMGYRLKPSHEETRSYGDGKKKYQDKQQTAARLGKIIERGKHKIIDRLAVIESAVLQLRKNKLSKKLRGKAEQEAHKLVESLGMFGNNEGSSLARQIEQLFQGKQPILEEEVLSIVQLLAALRQEVKHINTGETQELLSIESTSERGIQSRAPKEAKVMVVDEDKSSLAAVKELLVPWGMEVLTLDNPLLFWDVLVLEQPELLVINIEFAEISGLELCQIIRDRPRWSGLPIIVLGTNTDTDTRYQVFANGADDYVSKPIVGPELVTRILNRLERTRLLRSLAEIDTLTGLANRHKSTQQLNSLLSNSISNNQHFCLAVLSLDYLKTINQRYGHAAGDKVLSQLAELLQQNFSESDVIGRWGGKEFVIAVYGATKTQGVQLLVQVLDNLRKMQFTATDDRKFQATFSAGVVQYPQNGVELQTLYQAAEVVLDKAKKSGRNCVLSG